MVFKFSYLILMVFGTFLTLSSSSWFVAWLGLEINMMGFIPFVGVRGKIMSESVFKYFLVQAIGSLILFMVGLMGSTIFGYWMFVYDFLFSGGVIVFLMSLKMGASPFHSWFLSVSEGLDWVSLSVLMTWQSLAPLGLIMISGWSMVAVILIGVMSVVIGGLGGLNQLVVSKILAYSSISHLGWMSVLFLLSSYCGVLYFLVYTIVSLGLVYYFFGSSYTHLGQFQYTNHVGYLVFGSFCLSLFSLGGLPPFLGFYSSWIGILSMLEAGYFWLVLFYVMVGLYTLYFYLRLGYVWFLSSGGSGGWWMFEGVYLYFWGLLTGAGSLFMLPIFMYIM
nr:NADH dehydrogenase subunit 2 [Polydesmus sp. GZCS-2019]